MGKMEGKEGVFILAAAGWECPRGPSGTFIYRALTGQPSIGELGRSPRPQLCGKPSFAAYEAGAAAAANGYYRKGSNVSQV